MRHGQRIAITVFGERSLACGESGTFERVLDFLPGGFSIDFTDIVFSTWRGANLHLLDVIIDGERRFGHGGEGCSGELFTPGPWPLGVGQKSVAFEIRNTSGCPQSFEGALWGTLVDRRKV